MAPDEAEESALVVARRHVRDGRRIIADQRRLVEMLRARGRGRDVYDAEKILESFERAQAVFDDHLHKLEADRWRWAAPWS